MDRTDHAIRLFLPWDLILVSPEVILYRKAKTVWLKGEFEPYPLYSFLFNILPMRYCDTRLFKTGTETSRPFIYQSPGAKRSEKWLTDWKSSREIEQLQFVWCKFLISIACLIACCIDSTKGYLLTFPQL